MIRSIVWAMAVIASAALFAFAQDNDGTPQPALNDNDTPAVVDETVLKEKLDYLKDQAMLAIRKGEYPYAQAMLEQYIELDNEDFKVHEYLSQVYLYERDYQNAMRILERAVNLKPSFVSGHVNLARIYRDYGYEDLAMDHLIDAIQYRKDAYLVHEMGLTYERFNKLDKARQAYNDAIILDPDYAEAYFSLGLLDFRDRNFEDAVKEIQHALFISPDNTQYQTYLDKAQKALEMNAPAVKKDND